MFISSKYGTLESLLNRLFNLFEYDSSLYIDDLGYKWYELNVVLDVLEIDEDEYINGLYLMEIGDKHFISEEGVNVLLLEYDNEYQDDLKAMLTSEVLPDIKSDSMYLANHMVEDMRTMSIRYQTYVGNSTEKESEVSKRLQKYCNKKFNRRQKIKSGIRKQKNNK